jgi:hypothetical protein
VLVLVWKEPFGEEIALSPMLDSHLLGHLLYEL